MEKPCSTIYLFALCEQPKIIVVAHVCRSHVAFDNVQAYFFVSRYDHRPLDAVFVIAAVACAFVP